MLRHWGIQPVLAASASQALAVLHAARAAVRPFRLILTDAQMPEIDGFAFLEQLRESQTPAESTIMMLSSSGQRRDEARCRHLGVAVCLSKPIRRAELEMAILDALDERPPEGTVAPLVTIRPRHRAPAAKPLRVLLAEDNVINQRLAIRLLEKQGHQVSLAGNGKEVLSALAGQTFDVVLMDVQMPEMTGLRRLSSFVRERRRAAVTSPSSP